MEIKEKFIKMKEENKRQNEEFTKKINEGNETLKDTLKKIKKNNWIIIL